MSKNTTPDAETATVPLAFGIVMVLSEEAGVSNVNVFVIAPDVEVI